MRVEEVSVPYGFAFIAGGQLFLKEGSAKEKPHRSPFMDGIVATAGQIQRRHAWKTQGTGARFMMQYAPESDDVSSVVRVKDVSRGTSCELLYTFSSDAV